MSSGLHTICKCQKICRVYEILIFKTLNRKTQALTMEKITTAIASYRRSQFRFCALIGRMPTPHPILSCPRPPGGVGVNPPYPPSRPHANWTHGSRLESFANLFPDAWRCFCPDDRAPSGPMSHRRCKGISTLRAFLNLLLLLLVSPLLLLLPLLLFLLPVLLSAGPSQSESSGVCHRLLLHLQWRSLRNSPWKINAKRCCT